MRADLWIERASKLEAFDGKGLTVSAVAAELGLTPITVKRYAEKFGFDFGGAKLSKESREQTTARLDRIKELAAKGLTRQQVADQIGLHKQVVGRIGRENGIRFVHGALGSGVDMSRAEAMAAMYKGGKTLEEIGNLFGVTRERVRQIIKKQHGLIGSDGGQATSVNLRKQKLQARRDAESIAKHGCLYEEYRSLVILGREMRANGASFSRTPTGAFASQRNNAIFRGIGWNLKIWDWWQVWQKSGKWDQRGRGKESYVMCRFKDDGAYEIGNVYIATQSHNASFQPNNPYRKGHPDHEKVMVEHRKVLREAHRKIPRSVRAKKNSDLPIGVTRNNGRFQAQIGVNGKNKYLGSFGSVEEAHAAYLSALSQIEERFAA